MFECVVLTRRNLNVLRNLNSLRTEFNELNKDFFERYDSSNFAQQIFLRRNVRLLKKEKKLCGYIWFTKEEKDIYIIESMYVEYNTDNYIKGYNSLIDGVSMFSNLQYLCQTNDYNRSILNDLMFNVKQGTLELIYDINGNNINVNIPQNVSFERFVEGRDESIRCKIQNVVFKSNSRIPLTVEDIYYDESQSYYLDEGALFVKVNGEYAGYGQVILENMIPVIVNVGILNEYRGKGLGKYLLLELLKIIRDCQYSNVKIRVNTENYIALKLYKNIGFKESHYKYLWELKRG
jgi:GNAT superfamily N-acetyltransferase